jgi:hypothetical protein
MAGPEARATDQAGEGRDGEPGSGVASFAVEAGELLSVVSFRLPASCAGKPKSWRDSFR